MKKWLLLCATSVIFASSPSMAVSGKNPNPDMRLLTNSVKIEMNNPWDNMFAPAISKSWQRRL